MSIAVVNFLDDKSLKKAIKKGFTKIQYLKKDSILNTSLHKNIELIDGSDFTKIHWNVYNDLALSIEKINTELPSFFEYRGINLKKAILKDLVWECLKDYCLINAKKISGRDEDYQIIESRESKFVTFIKIIIRWAQSFTVKKKLDTPSCSIQNKIIVNAVNRSQIKLYEEFYQKIGLNNISILSSENNLDLSDYPKKYFGVDFSVIKPPKSKSTSMLQIVKCLSLTDLILLHKIISIKSCLCDYVNLYTGIFSLNPAAIVDTAGENNGRGIIISLTAKKHNVISFNYMNGAKANEPNNLDTAFDYWFMPDKATKELLISYTQLQANQLPVIGHLSKDILISFKPKNVLSKYCSNYLDKKIISFYTSPLYRDEQIEVLKTLAKNIDQSKYIVFIKFHPSDLEKLNGLPQHFIQLPVDKEINKNTLFLYELFYYSHISISFSSTICKEASFFTGTSINYERREISSLPFVAESKEILHVKNKEELNTKLDSLLNDDSPPAHGIKIIPEQSVAEKMANFITEKIEANKVKS